jgi:hypothetical protein
MTAGGLMFAAEGLAAPQLADCRAHENASRKAHYLCSRRRRLPADTAPVRALGSGEGDRAAELGLTIQIVAKHSSEIAGPDDAVVANPIMSSESAR